MFKISRKRITIISVSIFSLIVVVLALGLGLFFITPAKEGGSDQVIVLKEGMSLKEVADELERTEIISNSSLFMLWASILGYSRKIKAGEYRLNSDMPPIMILKDLTRGAIITHSITIPEGFTKEQIAELLASKGLANKHEFLLLTEDPDVSEKYGVRGSDLEGYLYPDTYRFSRGLSAESIIHVMVNRFWSVVGPLKVRVSETGMTMGEVVTLASIVEKETGRSEERTLIASVFLNRLKRGMRLESDPTVIYGITNFNGNLTRKDLSTPTPYNTYFIRGLPPSPIANPGLEAIKAVLYPVKTDYVYFVSKNNGSHYFSYTLSEHNKAVNRYQKKRPKRH